MSAKAATPPQSPPQPPDEQFWQRYSPHGEAPLSFAGSLTLHLLIGGLLFLAIAASAAAVEKISRKVPVEPVRLKIPGGGGGDPRGKDKGSGAGDKDATGEEGGEGDVTQPGLDDTVPVLPDVQKADPNQVKQKFAPEDARFIEKSNNNTAHAIAKLNDNLRKKITPGDVRGKGEGGPGKDGGKDKGVGKGQGDGKGDGKASLTQREKRMLRWHMRFSVRTGKEYVDQLADLGAILAFPVTGGNEPEYQLVRNLRQRPATLLKEDVENVQRIYWIDDDRKSVNQVVTELGLRISPRQFVAFMPAELEDELFKMERNYVEKVLRRKFDEAKIDETHFKVERKGGKYRPELLSVTMRR